MQAVGSADTLILYTTWQPLLSYPITGLERSLGLQEVEAPRISRQSTQEGGEVVSHTPQEKSLVLISVKGWVDPRAIGRPEGLSHWKILVTAFGNRTRDLPACSAVPQPTAPPRTLLRSCTPRNIWNKSLRIKIFVPILFYVLVIFTYNTPFPEQNTNSSAVHSVPRLFRINRTCMETRYTNTDVMAERATANFH
jgi:hypothetical protein